ncbi:hypothetical protein [Pseudomonas sp. LT1P18]|uniref:hypothetical protein n=1 Tax=Pseudomonas arabinosi TaxID=3398357 RepID=UPI0039F1428D
MRTDTSYALPGQTEKDKRRRYSVIFRVPLNFLPIHRTNRDRGTVTIDFVRGSRAVFFEG